jgi:hypothetical protein
LARPPRSNRPKEWVSFAFASLEIHFGGLWRPLLFPILIYLAKGHIEWLGIENNLIHAAFGGKELVMKRALLGLTAVAVVVALAGVSRAGGEPPQAPQSPKPQLPGSILKIHYYVVKYRCVDWHKKSFPNALQASAFRAKLNSLGFQTYGTTLLLNNSVYYRLPVWRQKIFVGTANHGAAHALESWLRSIGCQTQLIHH